MVWYGGGENRRLHADRQGSIIAITDGTGAIQGINGYDEWGIPNDPVNTGRFQFSGQVWIAELGMFHYKARIYSPMLGQFFHMQSRITAFSFEAPVTASASVRLRDFGDEIESARPFGK